jgi:hypothetical protein
MEQQVVVPLSWMSVEALAREQEIAVLQWEDIGWRAGQASEVGVIA